MLACKANEDKDSVQYSAHDGHIWDFTKEKEEKGEPADIGEKNSVRR